MISKPISQYLDKEEAENLKDELDKAGIPGLVRRQGLPRIFSGFQNYMVLIDPKNVQAANPIVEKFTTTSNQKRKEMLHELTVQCPFCKSRYIGITEKKTLLQKIFYYGVIVRECKECGQRWYT